MQKINFNDRYGLTQAVIEGRKTMRRRVIKPQPYDIVDGPFGLAAWAGPNERSYDLKTRFSVGEVVAVAQSYEAAGFDPEYCIEGGLYAKKHAGWRNKMFVSAKYMPHQIRITGISCERLQDISDDDCIKEGVRGEGIGFFVPGIKCKDWSKESHVDTEDGMTWKLFPTRRQAFASLIDRVSGKGTWERNPWVVVYEFDLVK